MSVGTPIKESASQNPSPPSSTQMGIIYAILLALCVGLFFLVRYFGEQLTAPHLPEQSAVTRRSSSVGHVDVTLHVLATLASVIALGYGLGRLFRFLGQPAVIGEVVAGIILGPSFLGALSPTAMHWLIPGREADPHRMVLTVLQCISQLGIILYMFLVGLELNGSRLRTHARSAVAISHASIAVPFIVGAVLALWLYPALSHDKIPFTSFALFLGAAMSVTAFPVLARILTDRGLEHTDLGIVALGCAATDDVTAWCLLALVVGVAQSHVEQAAGVLAWSLGYIGFMFFVLGPVLKIWIRRFETGSLHPIVLPGLFIAVLLSAMATEAIGIHAVFGAFLLGAIIPHDSRISREVSGRLRDVVTILFMPAFFAVTGMNTQISLIDGWRNWGMCLAIILTATLGKFGGTVAAARWTGQDWRTAISLGALMNTRGLMELVVLNIGLGMGVISPTLFAMMVLMALATTMSAAPVLNWLKLPTKPTEAAT